MLKRFLAKMVLAVAVAASAATLSAATKDTPFNILCIDRADGVQERLMLDPALKITMSARGDILLIHPKITVEYTADEVSHFTFTTETEPQLYVGDHESSISGPEAPDRTILITGGYVKVSGTDDVTLHDVRGIEIARALTDGTSATLKTDGLPAGIYILRAGSTTLKIRL